MQYNLANNLDREKLSARLKALTAKGAVVEVTEKVFRTPNQNRYLHLLIGVVAMETGNSLEDAKVAYFKRLVNADLFCVRKTDKLGNTIDILRSSADLSQEEMSIAIDRFKRWGAENGIYLPNPEDVSLLKDIEMELGRNRAFLGSI